MNVAKRKEISPQRHRAHRDFFQRLLLASSRLDGKMFFVSFVCFVVRLSCVPFVFFAVNYPNSKKR